MFGIGDTVEITGGTLNEITSIGTIQQIVRIETNQLTVTPLEQAVAVASLAIGVAQLAKSTVDAFNDVKKIVYYTDILHEMVDYYADFSLKISDAAKRAFVDVATFIPIEPTYDEHLIWYGYITPHVNAIKMSENLLHKMFRTRAYDGTCDKQIEQATQASMADASNITLAISLRRFERMRTDKWKAAAAILPATTYSNSGAINLMNQAISSRQNVLAQDLAQIRASAMGVGAMLNNIDWN